MSEADPQCRIGLGRTTASRVEHAKAAAAVVVVMISQRDRIEKALVPETQFARAPVNAPDDDDQIAAKASAEGGVEPCMP